MSAIKDAEIIAIRRAYPDLDDTARMDLAERYYTGKATAREVEAIRREFGKVTPADIGRAEPIITQAAARKMLAAAKRVERLLTSIETDLNASPEQVERPDWIWVAGLTSLRKAIAEAEGGGT